MKRIFRLVIGCLMPVGDYGAPRGRVWAIG